jgi:hypothetical protein
MPKKRRVQFTLEPYQADFFESYAEHKGMSLSALAKMALFQYEQRFKVEALPRPLPPDAVQQSGIEKKK